MVMAVKPRIRLSAQNQADQSPERSMARYQIDVKNQSENRMVVDRTQLFNCQRKSG